MSLIYISPSNYKASFAPQQADGAPTSMSVLFTITDGYNVVNEYIPVTFILDLPFFVTTPTHLVVTVPNQLGYILPPA